MAAHTSEKGVVAAIVTAIRKEYPSAWVFKVVGGPFQMSGVPDLLVCVHGLLVGLEVKFQRPGESREAALSRVTGRQAAVIRDIRKAGGTADAVLSPQEALSVIALALHDQPENKNKNREQEEQ